ncbi:MAG: carboxypeptidase-like regulatory domain-containing protein [Armatimonadota bacterium]|nr:carboxypeptidase-like regulatory domain-containing protein [Armatimonadota bacterium]MCX7777728.1 carboxypeptidase-like regulatory domain-containing protein [Armatimonadota bacterium]MDW8025857.1 carboxypeptidase-like regulatory domain-containing protein [Armatimonadota bacterium]
MHPKRLFASFGDGVTGAALCIAFLAINLSIAQQAQQTPGSIVGRVYQSDGRTGVPNATVTAIPVAPYPGEQPVTKSTTTDATGAYRISDLPPGLYNLTASATGYQPVTKPNVRVDPAATVTVDIILMPQPGIIEGVVVRDADSLPIDNALVEALYAGVVVSSARTASSGVYTLTNVPAGEVEVRVSAAGYASQSRVVTVPAGGIITGVNFRLIALPLGSISGLVTRLIDGSVVGGVRIEVVDSAGRVVAFAITAPEYEEENGYRFNYRITVAAGIYNVRVATTGYSSVEKRNVSVISGRETKGINFAVSAFKSFKPGLHMMSLPYDYTKDGLSAAQVFELSKLKLATWITDPKKPLGGEYAYFDPTNVASPAYAFQIGRGYFLLTNTYLDFTREGSPTPSVYRFPIKLEVGWNLIGAPFTFAVDWLRSYIKPAGLEAIPITDLKARAFISTAIFTLREEWGGAETVAGYYQIATTLEPYKAYWVYALQPVELLVDNQPVRMSRHTSQDEALKLLKVHAVDSFLLRLRAMCGASVDSDNFVGVANNASDGFDVLDIPEPPKPFGLRCFNLSLIQRTENGEMKCAVDLRSNSSRAQNFLILIEGNEGGVVTLSLEPLNKPLKDVRATLIDNERGVTIDPFTQRPYSFSIGAGERRYLNLKLLHGAHSPLRILNLRQLPSRGGALVLSFTLTQPAKLRLSLLTLTGRLIMRIEPSKVYGRGGNILSVRLPDNLPDGFYVANVEASGVESRASVNAAVRINVAGGAR